MTITRNCPTLSPVINGPHHCVHGWRRSPREAADPCALTELGEDFEDGRDVPAGELQELRKGIKAWSSEVRSNAAKIVMNISQGNVTSIRIEPITKYRAIFGIMKTKEENS